MIFIFIISCVNSDILISHINKKKVTRMVNILLIMFENPLFYGKPQTIFWQITLSVESAHFNHHSLYI